MWCFLWPGTGAQPVDWNRLRLPQGNPGKVWQSVSWLVWSELCRYISIQLLDRFIPSGGGKMEIREVEIEGWARSCGMTVRRNSVVHSVSLRLQLSPDRRQHSGRHKRTHGVWSVPVAQSETRAQEDHLAPRIRQSEGHPVSLRQLCWRQPALEHPLVHQGLRRDHVRHWRLDALAHCGQRWADRLFRNKVLQ